MIRPDATDLVGGGRIAEPDDEGRLHQKMLVRARRTRAASDVWPGRLPSEAMISD